MSDSSAKDLIKRGDQAFTKKQPILSLWQAFTEQFYPEHADFTYVRSMGMEFASHLMTGVPAQASRDLANAISATCRPPGQVWFHPRTGNPRLDRDNQCLRWLDYAGNVTQRAFGAKRSGFDRATKETDRVWGTIGNGCIRVKSNFDFTGLSFRTKHMRDVAFVEDADGFINEIHVKDKMMRRNMVQAFPKTVSKTVKDGEENDPYGMIDIRHIVLPSREYDAGPAKKEAGPKGTTKRAGYALPFVSVILDIQNETVLEEIGQHDLGYVTPRWETVPGFGYGYAPTTVLSISDSRMLQQITLTLLEAGQKAVDPPMQAVGNDVIQGGVNLYAGAISWIDPEYDERSGPAIKPLWQANPNLGWGVDREKRIADVIASAHLLNQIKFPDTTKARTAYETQKMWEEFVRTARPLFDPLMSEYNAPLCDMSFQRLIRMNAFGPHADIPRPLRGMEVNFSFITPLDLGQQSANAQAFTAAMQLSQAAAAIDPTVVSGDFDLDTAYRDALTGAGAPATWIVPEAVANAKKAANRKMMAEQQQQQQALDAASQVGDVAQKFGNAASKAGVNPGKLGAAANQLSVGGSVPPQMPQVGGAV